jgi:ribose transport system substrate-binding protein
MKKVASLAAVLGLSVAMGPVAAMAQTAEELMTNRLGTTDADPVIVETFKRAAQPVTDEIRAKALECWNNNSCD